MNRYFALAASLAATATLVLSACSGPAGTTPQNDADTELCSGGKISIGSVKALSGPFSFFDSVGNKSDALAVELVNRAGGINGCPVELTTKDMKSDPAVGSQVAREVLRAGAQILLVPNDQDLGMPAAQVAQGQGVFSLSPAGASDTFGTGVGSLFANGGTTSAELADAAVRFAEEKGFDSVYYVTLDRFAYFNLMEERFKNTSGLTELGRSVIAPGQTDFASVVSDVRRRVPEGSNSVIYVASQYPDAPTLVNQLRQAGVATAIIGTAAFSSPDLPALLGPNTQDVYYAAGAYFEGDDVAPDAAEFIEAYRAKYGAFPENLNAIESYWTMWALFEAIGKANSTEGAAIAEALFAQKNLQVPLKTIRSWADGHIVGSTVVIGFTPDGKFTKIASYDSEG